MLSRGSHSAAAVLYCPPLGGKAPALACWHPHVDPAASVQPLPQLDATQQQQADDILQHWPQWQVSRFNHYRNAVMASNDYVLVIWQQQASAEAKIQLLTRASQHARQLNLAVLLIDEADGAMVDSAEFDPFRQYCQVPVNRLTAPAHHALLLQHATIVYTLSSWLGFEALLWQRPVYGLADSFYQPLCENGDAGDDALAALVYKVFFHQLSWRHPDHAGPWHVAEALPWLALQRHNRQAFAPQLYAVGFKRYWRSTVRLFFQGSVITFVANLNDVPAGNTALVWGNAPKQLPAGVSLIRLEDGFLRSVGLGALFVRPLSWVADCSGMYFDARQQSDLEQRLSQQQFSDALLHRAQQLVNKLKQSGVSKYNTGVGSWQRPAQAKRCILVPGQVESDASIAYGAPAIKRNIDLLLAVRQANPDAYIIYKPHPDVVAGARKAGQQEDTALAYCDEQLLHTDINVLLQQVDEVHVLTSLAGFEALVRGKKVVCYGLPFYAGWGLTQDILSCPRRQRKLTLAQLVAATLLCYPLYISRHSGYYHSAEQTLADLMLWRTQVKKPHWLKQKLISGIRKIAGIT